MTCYFSVLKNNLEWGNRALQWQYLLETTHGLLVLILEEVRFKAKEYMVDCNYHSQNKALLYQDNEDFLEDMQFYGHSTFKCSEKGRKAHTYNLKRKLR